MSDTEFPNRKRRSDVAAVTGASPNNKSPRKKKPNRSGSKSRELQEKLQVGYAAITNSPFLSDFVTLIAFSISANY